jgi:hypothetical protein
MVSATVALFSGKSRSLQYSSSASHFRALSQLRHSPEFLLGSGCKLLSIFVGLGISLCS